MNEKTITTRAITTYSVQNNTLFEASSHKVGKSYNIPGAATQYPINNPRDLSGIAAIANYISFREVTSVYISYSGQEVWYKFTADASGAHPNADPGCYMFNSFDGYAGFTGILYDANGNIIKSETTTNSSGFNMSANLPCGAEYYFCVSGQTPGYYSIQIDYMTAEYVTDRMYLSFTPVSVPGNPNIKKAELTIYQDNGYTGNYSIPKIGIYHINQDITTGADILAESGKLIDYAVMKNGEYENTYRIKYTFDITSLVEEISKSTGQYIYPNLVIKAIDEDNSIQRYVTLFGASSTSYPPEITVSYESSHGINATVGTHVHDLGRFGKGIVDLKSGNLMLEADDFAWSGNRMPVTIKHLYNSSLYNSRYTGINSGLNVADFSAMNLGKGFKLNIMQSMTLGELPNGLTAYIYTDENGNENYFEMSDVEVTSGDGEESYYLYRDTDNNGMLYDPTKRELTKGENTYKFDTESRLVSITDKYANQMLITYTDGRITAVTDGAGRVFSFAYEGNYLTSVTAPDGTSIGYMYKESAESDNTDFLMGIIYSGDRRAAIGYNSGRPSSVTIYEGSDENSLTAVYKIEYVFKGYMLKYIDEYSDGVAKNAEIIYTRNYTANRTVVESREMKRNDTVGAEDEYIAENIIKTVYVFDNDGSVISEYTYTDDTGNTGTSSQIGNGILPHAERGIIQCSRNLLSNHGFNTLSKWARTGTVNELTVASQDNASAPVMFGRRALYLNSKLETNIAKGVYQETDTLTKGEYTFSVYVKSVSETVKVYLRIIDMLGNTISESEKISGIQEGYVRLSAPFSISFSQYVTVYILLDGQGTVYADGAQLEDKPYVNEYNMLEDGCFKSSSSAWDSDDSIIYDSSEVFNTPYSLKITGDMDREKNVFQSVDVNNAPGTIETFTLSGWAKANSLPCKNHSGAQAPLFRLRAMVIYDDLDENGNDFESFTADFCPDTEEWQYTSVQFSKNSYRPVNSVAVYCEYSYNDGIAYFDDIQLVRTGIETGLTAEDFDTEEDTPEIPEDDTTASALFEEARDIYGNVLTETLINDTMDTAIYRSFGYNKNDGAGNNLVSETDQRKKITNYGVDKATSQTTEKIDRNGNITRYEYDSSHRVTKIKSYLGNTTEMSNVSYAYDSFDNMTEIARGDGMKYVLEYNSHHNLASVGINGNDEKLVTYGYNNGSGRLKEVTYANNETMVLTYNRIGQLTDEKWYYNKGEESEELRGHCNYVYDGHGNIVRSIDFFESREYNYIYENDVLVRATEYDITVNSTGDAVTSRSIVSTIFYIYSNGTLTKKRIVFPDGEEHVITYNAADGTTSVTDNLGFTAASVTDSLGRKSSDSVTAQSSGLSRQFEYYTGEASTTHIESGKDGFAATTRLVSRITLAGGRTLEYTYDNEERITKVTDTLGTTVTTTEYTYDALGQLKTEKVNGEVVNSMTYDNYGNILSKNGKTYTYDTVWKDKLTGYGNNTITYDAQGNPTNYFGNSLVWEKGRRLKQFGTTSYTYNANGIRTEKSIGGIVHRYCLEGTRILRETWANNVLIPLYDNEESICGIRLNQTLYLFVKNLQGDILSVADEYGTILVNYRYDAWGKCTVVSDTSGFNLSAINPFRYRGYYFDTETNLYYLQSRYYDPEVGRFLNADEALCLGKNDNVLNNNIFSYCNNTPINAKDENGKKTEYINNQWDENIRNMKWGMLGNTGQNGCGWISVYNIMVHYSDKITPKHVIGELSLSMSGTGALALGLLGANPIGITQYLRRKFWFVYFSGPVTNLWGIKAELSGGIIVLYQHSGLLSSLHYVAGIKVGNGTGGEFKFYNDSYYDRKYPNKKPISIWKYIDLLKENGCKPISFWGVAGKLGWW